MRLTRQYVKTHPSAQEEVYSTFQQALNSANKLKTQKSALPTLPVEILLQIVGFLDKPKDLRSFALSCKEYASLASESMKDRLKEKYNTIMDRLEPISVSGQLAVRTTSFIIPAYPFAVDSAIFEVACNKFHFLQMQHDRRLATAVIIALNELFPGISPENANTITQTILHHEDSDQTYCYLFEKLFARKNHSFSNIAYIGQAATNTLHRIAIKINHLDKKSTALLKICRVHIMLYNTQIALDIARAILDFDIKSTALAEVSQKKQLFGVYHLAEAALIAREIPDPYIKSQRLLAISQCYKKLNILYPYQALLKEARLIAKEI